MKNLRWAFSLSLALCSFLCALLSLTACRATSAPAPDQAAVASPTVSSQRPETTTNSKIGFASRQKWVEHFEKHGREFGNLTADEYLRKAQTLRDCALNADILESVRRDSVVTRFDKQSGAFLAFNQDLTIRTFFKPNDGANYFWRQSKR